MYLASNLMVCIKRFSLIVMRVFNVIVYSANNLIVMNSNIIMEFLTITTYFISSHSHIFPQRIDIHVHFIDWWKLNWFLTFIMRSVIQVWPNKLHASCVQMWWTHCLKSADLYVYIIQIVTGSFCDFT